MKGAELLLIHGEERFLIDREARAWLSAARQQALSDLDVEVLDAPPRLEGLRAGLMSVPFLAERRAVLLRDPTQLLERPRRGAESADALAAALAERAPTTVVCIVVHQRIAPANPVLNLVRSQGRVIEHAHLRPREFRGAVDTMVTARALRLPRVAVDHLVLVSGGDLGVIDSELDKLVAFAAGSPVNAEDARRLLAGAEQVEIWDLLERLLSPPHGRGAAARESLLAEGVSTQYVITVLSGQIRELLMALDLLAGGGGPGVVAAELGLPPWRADRLTRWASAVTPPLVEGWLRALQQLDADVKMGLADDAAGLRSLVLRAVREVGDARSVSHRQAIPARRAGARQPVG
jgi:DNA polymerase-3 subunit delta